MTGLWKKRAAYWRVKMAIPLQKVTTLVIPKHHTADFFSITETERNDAMELLRYLSGKLVENAPSVMGFNIEMNCSEKAGQSIFQAHWHLIPRRQGDSESKRGGIRGVVLKKMGYGE